MLRDRRLERAALVSDPVNGGLPGLTDFRIFFSQSRPFEVGQQVVNIHIVDPQHLGFLFPPLVIMEVRVATDVKDLRRPLEVGASRVYFQLLIRTL